MSEFKGTRGKRPQGWAVYFAREIGTGEVCDITIMPKGNSNSNEDIAICWDKSKIGRNGGLKLEEAKANAQLISKAPEMLEMLAKCKNTLSDIYQCDVSEIEQLIKEATTI